MDVCMLAYMHVCDRGHLHGLRMLVGGFVHTYAVYFERNVRRHRSPDTRLRPLPLGRQGRQADAEGKWVTTACFESGPTTGDTICRLSPGHQQGTP